MKFMKLFPLAAVILMVATSTGCIGMFRDIGATPTPVITPTVTPAPTPTLPAVNDTIERQYNYVDKLNSGINEYNAGIGNMKTAQSYYNAYNDTNPSSANLSIASDTILIARNNMENAKVQFKGMEQYASTDAEYNLSGKWYETANYYSIALNYLSQGYLELKNQSGHNPPNYIKERFYMEQAKYYGDLAQQSFAQAKSLEKDTFIGRSG